MESLTSRIFFRDIVPLIGTVASLPQRKASARSGSTGKALPFSELSENSNNGRASGF